MSQILHICLTNNVFFAFVIITNFFLDIPDVFMNGTAEEFLAIDQGLGLTVEFSNHDPKNLRHIMSK